MTWQEKQHCPYKYKYELVEWAMQRYNISRRRARSYTKEQLFAMYYKPPINLFQDTLPYIQPKKEETVEQVAYPNKEQIKKAHKNACPEGQQVLEDLFPELLRERVAPRMEAGMILSCIPRAGTFKRDYFLVIAIGVHLGLVNLGTAQIVMSPGPQETFQRRIQTKWEWRTYDYAVSCWTEAVDKLHLDE